MKSVRSDSFFAKSLLILAATPLLFGILFGWFHHRLNRPYPRPEVEHFFAYSALGPPFFPIDPFEELCRIELFRTDPLIKRYPFERYKTNYELSLDTSDGILTINKINLSLSLAVLVKKIDQYLSGHRVSAAEVPQEVMTLDWSQGKKRARWIVYNLSGRLTPNGMQVDHIKSDLLLKIQ